MRRKKFETRYDQKLVEALKKLPPLIIDRKHNLTIHIENDMARKNETRFEHIAKRAHELKVRDIESIPDGVINYVKFSKSKELKETYYYYFYRKGNDKGFVQLAIKLYEGKKHDAYIKTIFVTYRFE